LSKAYEPSAVESRWYAYWDAHGYFQAEPEPGRASYCLTIPPPNVTGELHIGHALQHAIHDTLLRWRRMSGLNTLCVPGTDHASIGTERLLTLSLKKQGISKMSLGRDGFVKAAWDWTEKYGGTILKQLRLLGCSYDWRRTRFTMDEGYVRAVLTAFLDYYERGWIYRGSRVGEWCPSCNTSLSDLEVDHEEVLSSLWHIRYPIQGGGSVTVATTRPETMLGDTAVAVHPDDPRHKGHLGKTVLLPVMDREIPIIADPILVDPKFGTGAVKVTPAHDPNDFECGQRNNLPRISVIGKDGRMTEAAGRFAGLDRLEARKQVVDELERLGLLEKVEEYTHAVGHCERCHTIVEPLLTDQWYLRMQDLAALATDAIKSGRVRFFPDRYAAEALRSLENVPEWCISRQLFWGHRLPLWHCRQCAAVTPSIDRPAACKACGSSDLYEDPDTLDTWFSSALWPFAVLGWPDNTPEMEAFYPTNCMITDRQIIRLWVLRMVYSGLHFVKEIPFPDVYIHGTVLTREGVRMSKSKGTGGDPVELINKYGGDATRMSLLLMASKGQDIRFAEERVEGSRRFANKLWNASRFVMMNLANTPLPQSLSPDASWPLEDRWILSRLNRVLETVSRSLGEYDFDDAAQALHEFVWNEFCDWYVELAKARFSGPEEDAARVRQVLAFVLETSLRTLHPFMPFVTEEIWQSLRTQLGATRTDSLMVQSYPAADPALTNDEAEERFSRIEEMVRTVRNLRAQGGAQPAQRVQVYVVPIAEDSIPEIEVASLTTYLSQLARAELTLLPPKQTGGVPSPSVAGATRFAEVHLSLAGLVDVEKETAKLTKEIEAITKELSRVTGKLQNSQFLSRAPAEVVDKERAIEQELKTRKHQIEAQLSRLKQTS
jgi:valyl-tRNA synthetase